jgi:hypothetical protein
VDHDRVTGIDAERFGGREVGLVRIVEIEGGHENHVGIVDPARAVLEHPILAFRRFPVAALAFGPVVPVGPEAEFRERFGASVGEEDGERPVRLVNEQPLRLPSGRSLDGLRVRI